MIAGTATINRTKISLQATIQKLPSNQQIPYKIVQQNVKKLTDLKHNYNISNPLEKQELIRLGFDSNMYYEKGIYRTPKRIAL